MNARPTAPHSAAPHRPGPPEDLHTPARAPRRAGAREVNADTAQSQPHSAVAPNGPQTAPSGAQNGAQNGGQNGGHGPAVDMSKSAPGDPSDDPRAGAGDGAQEGAAEGEGKEAAGGFGRFVAWLGATFVPPDIWSDDQPSLARVWEYAVRGQWTDRTGWLRVLSGSYAVAFALPVTAVLYALAWAVDRPTRLAAVALVLFLLRDVLPWP